MQIFPGPALLLMLFFLFVYVIKVQGCCGAGRLVLDPEPKTYDPGSDYLDSTYEKKKKTRSDPREKTGSGSDLVPRKDLKFSILIFNAQNY